MLLALALAGRFHFQERPFEREWISGMGNVGATTHSSRWGRIFEDITQSATRATWTISATSCTRTICAPLRMLAVTVAAEPQMRSSGGAGFPSRASVAPKNHLRDATTERGWPS